MGKKVLHVNQAHIRKNRTTLEKSPEEILPVFTCKFSEKGKRHNIYSNSIVFKHQGVEIGRLVYTPTKPLSCGARAYIVLTDEAEVEYEDGKEYKDL